MMLTRSGRMAALVVPAFLAIMLFASQAFANNVYTLTFSDFPAGTITTDGATGVLSSSDIVGWNLTLGNGGRGSPTLAPGTSLMALIGGALSATASQLTFDFASTNPGYLSFSNLSPQNPNNADAVEFCDQNAATTCLDQYGNPGPNGQTRVIWVDPGCCSSGDYHAEYSAQVIATNSSAPVSTPEPPALPILAMSLGLTFWLSQRTPRRSNTRARHPRPNSTPST